MEATTRAAAMQELLAATWAIRPEYVRSLWAGVSADLPPEARAATPAPSSTRAGASVTIPITGPISRRPSFFSFLFGGSSVAEISASLRAALADPSVDRVVLQIDSPGGAVEGMPELAAEIFAGRSVKPITAVVDSTGASAAYWLASQASEILIAPSGSVGSIGVFALHLDRSRQMDAAGVTPTLISAGRFKTEGNPLEPLDEDARAEIQKRVDAFEAMFVSDVARGRGVTVEHVRASFGEGRMVLAKDAVSRGMADAVMPLATAARTSPLKASLDQRALLAVAHANASRIQQAIK